MILLRLNKWSMKEEKKETIEIKIVKKKTKKKIQTNNQKMTNINKRIKIKKKI